ncbi:MAG TPA: MarR family transcriptional regulator [Prolixibacteraceae bacterium]|jgi:DNA-binding MarR family transcriptional regulator|nr:MarR family transcriptional regulator [Prolixibacteraceae bacterium]
MSKLKVDSIAENIISVYPLLYKTISRPIKHQSSVTPGGMFVMGSLKRNGVMSMSDIGKCLAMPKPHVTVIVDKLIEEGFVERQNDPNDRRIINILLTEKGLDAFLEIKATLAENMKIKLLNLSEEEQETLAVASQQVKDMLISILSKE